MSRAFFSESLGMLSDPDAPTRTCLHGRTRAEACPACEQMAMAFVAPAPAGSLRVPDYVSLAPDAISQVCGCGLPAQHAGICAS